MPVDPEQGFDFTTEVTVMIYGVTAPATSMNVNIIYVEYYEKDTDALPDRAVYLNDLDWSPSNSPQYTFGDLMVVVKGFTFTPEAPKVSAMGVSFDIDFTTPTMSSG
jgi:hypothetical protein